MNFNFSQKSEYTLNKNMTSEMIKLYGVLTKFLKTEKINLDSTVFGDFSHLKTDNTKIFEIYMLPENTEGWDSSGFNLTAFGPINFDNINLFASKDDFSAITHDEIKEIISGLIIFPNNKIMEITNVEQVVPGINNLFTYNDTKSVLKLSCKPYEFKLINELNTTDISVDPLVPYDTLDTYFAELINTDNEQHTETITLQTDVAVEIDQVSKIPVRVDKPVVDSTEKDIWGNFA